METALPMAGAPAAAPELDFAVEGAAALEHAAVPTLALALRISAAGGARVRSIALSVEIRIAATRRSYGEGEEERLADLFGTTDQWTRSLRTLHWTSVTVNVPPFTGSTEVEVPVTCTYDLEVTAAKYLHALEDGEVPLELLFGGSVFYADQGGRLQVGLIASDREAQFRMPVATWRDVMDRHFPDAAWIRLRRDSFDRLRAYGGRHAHLGWDETVDALLREAGE